MFVKVCGITNFEDAQAAIDAGANGLGFIFHPPSPRYINPQALSEWLYRIPENITTVGVFVNSPAHEVARTVAALQLDVAQLHGNETAGDIPDETRVWKAFRVTAAIDPAARTFPAEAILLDGPGSGQSFDWSLARDLNRRFLLAGGLNENNVAEAIEQANPWGADVCSCLELRPGKKDHARMARFLKACQPILSM